MIITKEMKVYEDQVNITLLNDIIDFIADTAATSAQKYELRMRCLWLTYSSKNNFQQKYGFLYLGELLERYEERFGMSDADFRAIALALGYTQTMLTDEMFIGNQRIQFMQKLRRLSTDDIYLKGALYLLSEGQSSAEPLQRELNETQYKKTEELVFILSLFGDFERAFQHFQPQLLSLLGCGRTMPIIGNTGILDWLIERMLPLTKTIKNKDMQLVRALCSLPTSFVKEDSKYHAVLLEHGYTSLEIVYANMMTVQYQSAPKSLGITSIVTQKMAVALFHEVLSLEQSFEPEIYDQLTEVFTKYKDFDIKCYGEKELLNTLKDGLHIKNAQTFMWFYKLADKPYHPVFDGFDIQDTMWDSLASNMENNSYLRLFETQLESQKSEPEIQQLICRYDCLTGLDYIASYFDENNGSRFNLLVNKGLIDLWKSFLTSLKDDDSVAKPEMLENIRRYLDDIKTLQAFQFYQKFLPEYGFPAFETYFGSGYYKLKFSDSLMKATYYSNSNASSVDLKLQRDFLSEEEHLQLLHWLEEYLFSFDTGNYLSFIVAVLKDDFAVSLLPSEELRKLFDLVISQESIVRNYASELKRKYLTPEEQQAEKDAQKATSLEREKLRKKEAEQKIRIKYDELFDGSFVSVMKFMNEYKYSSENEPISMQVVYGALTEILQDKNYELDRQNAVQFLFTCSKLVKEGVMALEEAQNYISMIKEVTANDAENNEATNDSETDECSDDDDDGAYSNNYEDE